MFKVELHKEPLGYMQTPKSYAYTWRVFKDKDNNFFDLPYFSQSRGQMRQFEDFLNGK